MIPLPRVGEPISSKGAVGRPWFRFFRDLAANLGFLPESPRYMRQIVPWSAMHTVPAAASLTGVIDAASFDAATDNDASGCLLLPYNWVPESDIGITLVWAQSGTDTGNAHLGIAYIVRGHGDAAGAATSEDKTVAAPGVSGQFVYTDFTDISGAGLSPGDVIAFDTYRYGAKAGDTLTDDSFLLGLIFQFRISGVGLVAQ